MHRIALDTCLARILQLSDQSYSVTKIKIAAIPIDSYHSSGLFTKKKSQKMNEMSQYGSITSTPSMIDLNQNDSKNESNCTIVTRVDKVSKQYLISEYDYNHLSARSKLFCTIGGIAATAAVGCLIYHLVAERHDSRVINTILMTLAQGLLFVGMGIGMATPLVHTREYTLPKHS